MQGDKGFIPFRQLGQYEDEETGLYYNRFRYYSPDSGTCISQDPIIFYRKIIQRNGNVRYIKDFGRTIGSKGEMMQRVIFNPKK